MRRIGTARVTPSSISLALDAHEAVLQTTTLQVVVKFLFYEFRHNVITLAQMLDKFRQMMLDDLIQQRQFRTVTNIWSGCNVWQDP
jgi:hypothetical protein